MNSAPRLEFCEKDSKKWIDDRTAIFMSCRKDGSTPNKRFIKG